MTLPPSARSSYHSRRFFRPLPILGLLLLILAAPGAVPGAPEPLAAADSLLAGPSLSLAQAQAALAQYETLLAASQTPRAPLLTRLARVCFILADLVPKAQRQPYYDKGLGYAEQLLKENPGGVAGHYWKALNLAGLADVGGRLRGFKLLPRILEELQKSLSLNEAYEEAGAHRVLGRIYYEAPGRPFSVGDLNKSLQHLTAAARLAPQTSTNHLYLAETMLRLGQTAPARQELERTLAATHHATQPQGLREDQQAARRLLAEMKGK